MDRRSADSHDDGFELLSLDRAGSVNEYPQETAVDDDTLLITLDSSPPPYSNGPANDTDKTDNAQSFTTVQASNSLADDEKAAEEHQRAADVERLRAFLAYRLTVDYNCRTPLVPDLPEEDKKVYEDCQALIMQIGWMRKSQFPLSFAQERRNHPLIQRFLAIPCFELQIELDYAVCAVCHYVSSRWRYQEDSNMGIPIGLAARHHPFCLAQKIFNDRTFVVPHVIQSEEIRRELMRRIETVSREQFEWVRGERPAECLPGYWPIDRFDIFYKRKGARNASNESGMTIRAGVEKFNSWRQRLVGMLKRWT